ncbi:hypothetical protein [Streptomyces sp. NBC_00009]|uniref:hypothetical protein n=1 Tax=Streptomyces sp. NBC_00009 TaxID=2975620 RepID=UPI003249D310
MKGSTTTRLRDLPYGESGLEFRWHKRRWWCHEPGCPRRSFTEQTAQIPAGARITTRLRAAAGRLDAVLPGRSSRGSAVTVSSPHHLSD